MSTVLVTGAMGQVGEFLVDILLRRGHAVVALGRDTVASRATAARMAPAAGTTGTLVPAFVDVTDADALLALFAEHRPDAVVHLAAVLAPPAYKDPAHARRVNVDGTAHLVAAARSLATRPLFVNASSSAVYGSRNPHRSSERLSGTTALDPIDCYGAQKVEAEAFVTASGLPYAHLRIAGVMAPDTIRSAGADLNLLLRATPRDNRIHMVDGRDVALAFANAVDRGPAIDGRVLMIAGDGTCTLVQQALEDDLMELIGIGKVGPIGLLGDPDDDRGWSLTDWFDTTEAQALLEFQEHTWSQTLAWVAADIERRRRRMRRIGWLVRPIMRIQRRFEDRRSKRGPYADPWGLIAAAYGPDALAPEGN